MRIFKIVAISFAGLVVIALWVAAYLLLHSAGYDVGYETGYDEVYESACEQGHNEGYSAGYEMGYDEVYDNAYTAGYDAGYTQALGVGEVFRNPTYQEARDFLVRDTTDKKYYPVGSDYDCENFASDVCNNAEAEGIRAAVVFIDYKNSDSGHVVVAFETTDEGLIFIEPQSDKKVELEIGSRYWGETIERFVVIW